MPGTSAKADIAMATTVKKEASFMHDQSIAKHAGRKGKITRL
jgi:hypothetical protein